MLVRLPRHAVTDDARGVDDRPGNAALVRAGLEHGVGFHFRRFVGAELSVHRGAVLVGPRDRRGILTADAVPRDVDDSLQPGQGGRELDDPRDDPDVRAAGLVRRHPEAVHPRAVVNLGHGRHGRGATPDDLRRLDVDDDRLDAARQAATSQPPFDALCGLGTADRCRHLGTRAGEGEDQVAADKAGCPEDERMAGRVGNRHCAPPTFWHRTSMSSARTSAAEVNG